MMMDTAIYTSLRGWPTSHSKQLAGAGVDARCKSVLNGLMQRPCFWLLTHYVVACGLARLLWVVPLLVRVALFRIQSP
jgi:hypothetical protein